MPFSPIFSLRSRLRSRFCPYSLPKNGSRNKQAKPKDILKIVIIHSNIVYCIIRSAASTA